MAKGVKLIPKRKFDWVPSVDAFIQHIDQFIGTPDVVRIIKANDDRAVLELRQSGSGSVLDLTEADQTDPAGRYRFKINGGNLTLEKATAADWAAIQALLSVDSGGRVTTFESPDNGGDNWYTELSAGGAAGETTYVNVGSSGAARTGFTVRTGDGSGSDIIRLSITTGVLTAIAAWGSCTQTGVAIRDLKYVHVSELTISSGGAVTRTGLFHTIDTQNNDATDDLDTISGGALGDVLIIRARDAARTIVVKHGTGNIQLKAGVDITLDNIDKALVLFYAGSNWVDVGGGNIITDFLEDTPTDGELSKAPTSNWAFDHANDDDVHNATAINVSELSTATYDDVQDYINFFGDRTILSGGTITDNGDGTAAIASLTGWCKETDSDTAIGRFFDYGGGNTPALTDMKRNYVYIDYNGGTVQIVAATSLLTHGQKFDHILIGTIFRNGTILHWHQHHNIGIERVNTVDLYELEEHAAARVDGMVTSDAGSRAISLTSGVLYEGIDRETTSPFDTPNSGTADATEANTLHDADGGFASTDVGKSVHNTTDDTYAIVTAFVDSGQLTLDGDIFISGENYDLDIFSYWYTADSGSTWTEVRGSTLINNSQYNNIAAGLASLTTNRYGVHWVYMDLDGSNLHVVYGQGDYKANEAEEASVPSVLPPNVSEYGLLIAKIILQEGQTAMIIALPWITVFTSTLATDHGSLGGLSDDDHRQYIRHALATAANDFLVASGSGAYVKKTLAETLAIISPLTTRGDIWFRNATVDTRLAKGTDGQFLKIGANDPEWADVSAGISAEQALAYALSS